MKHSIILWIFISAGLLVSGIYSSSFWIVGLALISALHAQRLFKKTYDGSYFNYKEIIKRRQVRLEKLKEKTVEQ
ncbi:hypothetical protein [Terribacillus halophilus]|uniref:hypothetical protein n=1 Tax=Terribacillus halophilus TaxID=361279 RepID=UPI00398209C7